MFEDFMVRALLSGIALSLATGPVGCFILWKKLAYFGDTLAHSALLGVTLAIYLQIDAVIGVFVIAMLVSFVLVLMRRSDIISGDGALGIISHSALAYGLIFVSVVAAGSVNLNSLLFGDILAVSWRDVWVSFAVSIGILLVLMLLWRSLVARTISIDIAQVERIGSGWSELVFMMLCSGLVAIAMKITGILLISALLILPAATGRIFARSPEAMAVSAVLVGIAAVIGGLNVSLEFDFPSGPAIIAVASFYFFSALLFSRLVRMIRTGKLRQLR